MTTTEDNQPQRTQFEIKKKPKVWVWAIPIAVILVAVVAWFAFFRAPSGSATFQNPLKLASVQGAGYEKLFSYFNEEVGADYGVEIEPVWLTDFVASNQAVDNHEIAANLYQHRYFLEQSNEGAGLDLEFSTPVYQLGFGLFSQDYDSLEDLPDGATISVPNDPSNLARALLLLQEAGLIDLTEGVELPEESDIIDNPRKLQLALTDLTALFSLYEDFDATIGYGGAWVANGQDDDLLFLATPPDSWAVGLAIASDTASEELIRSLAEAWADPRIQQYIEDNQDDPDFKYTILPL